MSILCTRCGEELTALKFHNGKPYGYSCHEIIAGKKFNDKRQFVKIDEVIGGTIEGISYFPLTVRYNNRNYYLGATYKDSNGKFHNQLAEFSDDGSIYMVTHNKKVQPIWKNPV